MHLCFGIILLMNHINIITKTQQLIAIQSTADKPADLHAALDLIKGILKDVPNLTIEHFNRNNKPSLLAYIGKTRPKKFKVILNGHVDVVAAKPEQFIAAVKDGKLYGRGAVDMKTAAVALTSVFCDVAPKVDYPLGLQIVTDEELGGFDGTQLQMEQGVTADFALAGEFTKLGQICTESRGICQVEIILHGKSAHGAYLWDGQNALLMMQDLIKKILKIYPIPKQEQWATTVNVAKISTPNQIFNRVPDQATVMLDIRFIPGDKNFSSNQTVERLFASINPKAKVKIYSLESSHFASQDDLLVKELSKQLQKVTGQPTKFIRKYGGSDARYFSDHGSTAVVFGIQGKDLHGDDEHANIDSIEPYCKVLKNFLISLN